MDPYYQKAITRIMSDVYGYAGTPSAHAVDDKIDQLTDVMEAEVNALEDYINRLETERDNLSDQIHHFFYIIYAARKKYGERLTYSGKHLNVLPHEIDELIKILSEP